MPSHAVAAAVPPRERDQEHDEQHRKDRKEEMMRVRMKRIGRIGTRIETARLEQPDDPPRDDPARSAPHYASANEANDADANDAVSCALRYRRVLLGRLHRREILRRRRCRIWPCVVLRLNSHSVSSYNHQMSIIDNKQSGTRAWTGRHSPIRSSGLFSFASGGLRRSFQLGKGALSPRHQIARAQPRHHAASRIGQRA